MRPEELKETREALDRIYKWAKAGVGERSGEIRRDYAKIRMDRIRVTKALLSMQEEIHERKMEDLAERFTNSGGCND